MASHDSNVGDEAEYLRKKNLQDHEYTSISSPEKEDETEVVTSTKTAGPEFHTSKAREDEKELTDGPLKSYKPSVDNLAGSLASEEADKPAKPPPHVSAMNFGFDAISRQSPSYKKYSLLPRYAFDTSEEEDGGDGSEDEGAHLPAEPSPVDTSLPTPSRQPTGPWAIYATNDEDAKVPKAKLDAAMNSWEKAEAEVERRREEKNAVKNRKKKEKKRLKKQQNLEEAAQAALPQ